MTDTGLMEEFLKMLVYDNLALECPVLSGNMQNHIQYEGYQDNGWVMSISGPTYDINEWRKTGRIIPTNKGDYAISVNRLGAFGGKSKKSQFWVYNSLVNSVVTIASQFGAEWSLDISWKG